MIDTNELRGQIAKKGLSQSRVAKQLGISPNTFYRKMHIGVFDSTEILAIMKLLSIKDPTPIFFADGVAQHATKGAM